MLEIETSAFYYINDRIKVGKIYFEKVDKERLPWVPFQGQTTTTKEYLTLNGKILINPCEILNFFAQTKI